MGTEVTSAPAQGYRTAIDVWVFIAAGATAMAIAAFTVGFQSFSAANANPVEVLKNE